MKLFVLPKSTSVSKCFAALVALMKGSVTVFTDVSLQVIFVNEYFFTLVALVFLARVLIVLSHRFDWFRHRFPVVFIRL